MAGQIGAKKPLPHMLLQKLHRPHARQHGAMLLIDRRPVAVEGVTGGIGVRLRLHATRTNANAAAITTSLDDVLMIQQNHCAPRTCVNQST